MINSSFFARFLRIIGLLSLLIGVTVAFLPHLINTEWGRKRTIETINHFINGNVEIRSLEVEWKNRQIIEGLSLKDAKGKSILEIERLLIEAPLWKLLQRSLDIEFIHIQQLQANLSFDEKGKSNLEDALDFNFSVTPEFVAAFTARRIELHRLNHLKISSPYFIFPLEVEGVKDFHQCSFRVDIAIGRTDIIIPPLGLVNIHHLEAQLDSSAGNSNMHFHWKTYGKCYGKTININYERWYKKPHDLTAFLHQPNFEVATSNF